MMISGMFELLPLIGLALLLGAATYESVIMAPNFERDIPTSLELAKKFLARTPASYFRTIAPLTLLLQVVALVANWGATPARWLLLVAALAILSTDVVTFTFHYPRLKIMFGSEPGTDPALLKRAARGWSLGNFVRIFLLLVAFLCCLLAIVSLARLTP